MVVVEQPAADAVAAVRAGCNARLPALAGADTISREGTARTHVTEPWMPEDYRPGFAVAVHLTGASSGAKHARNPPWELTVQLLLVADRAHAFGPRREWCARRLCPAGSRRAPRHGPRSCCRCLPHTTHTRFRHLLRSWLSTSPSCGPESAGVCSPFCSSVGLKKSRLCDLGHTPKAPPTGGQSSSSATTPSLIDEPQYPSSWQRFIVTCGRCRGEGMKSRAAGGAEKCLAHPLPPVLPGLAARHERTPW